MFGGVDRHAFGKLVYDLALTNEITNTVHTRFCGYQMTVYLCLNLIKPAERRQLIAFCTEFTVKLMLRSLT